MRDGCLSPRPPSLHEWRQGVAGDLLLESLGTNWGTRPTHIEFQEDLDHPIAGCVAPRRRPNSLHFSRPGHWRTPELPPSAGTATFTQPPQSGGSVGFRGDALAEMPEGKPRAQLAFKDSMIRGILQFTLRIAFRCVLHRCRSQDIRC
jgi:hypothetical protein